MLDFIVNEFKKTIVKRIKKTASQKGKEEKDIQVLLGLDQQGENTYFICEHGVPKEEVDFMHLLDVKIDFMQKGQFVPPFIKKSLIEAGEKNNFKPNTASVMILKREDNSVRMCLYEGNKYVKDVKIEDFFSEE